MKRLAPIALAAGLLLAGCGKGGHEDVVVVVSVIGPETRSRNPADGPVRQGDAALLGAVAQGLVRLDPGAQVEPGLAMRWAISDDGLYYTFRLDQGLTDADRVVGQLRKLVRRQREVAPGGGLDAISEILAVTPEVIEMRLSAPRRELLQILAGPGFALMPGGKGTGPLLLDGRPGIVTTLRPRPIDGPDPDADRQTLSARRIQLHGERAAAAVARFARGEAALVTGGGFSDFIYTRLANIQPRAIQVDPATGLFGFRIARASGPMMAAEIRQALSMALDRDALGAILGIAGWRPAQAILPPGLTDLAEPTRPFWAQAFANVRGSDRQAFDQRVAAARKIVSAWHAQNRSAGPVRITVAMPDGPGAKILFAAIRKQWRRIGIDAAMVRLRDSADLRLIDAVAPSDDADWFLAHFLCDSGRPCSEEADHALSIARSTGDTALRARMIAETEQRLTAIAPFIPIAQPVRWSLAPPDLPGFRLNARAVHPLAPLIDRQKNR